MSFNHNNPDFPEKDQHEYCLNSSDFYSLKTQAKMGDCQAQFNFASWYEQRMTQEIDHLEELNQSKNEDTFHLGILKYNAHVLISCCAKEAYKYYKMAAKRGYADAQVCLTSLLAIASLKGLSEEILKSAKNAPVYRQWLSRAENQENIATQTSSSSSILASLTNQQSNPSSPARSEGDQTPQPMDLQHSEKQFGKSDRQTPPGSEERKRKRSSDERSKNSNFCGTLFCSSLNLPDKKTSEIDSSFGANLTLNQ